MFDLSPGYVITGRVACFIVCQFRIPSRLSRALTSDTSPTCLRRRRLSVRPVYDVQYMSITAWGGDAFSLSAV